MFKRPTRIVSLPQALNGLYKWDKRGFLINFRGQAGNQLIRIHDSQGKLVQQFSPYASLNDPSVQGIGINDIAVTNDGSIIVAITPVTEKEIASALLVYDESGSIEKVIKTDPYSVEKIAIDDENNIWLLGYDWQKSDDDLDWPLIRKISPNGVPLLSTLPRSLFPKEKDPLNHTGKGLIYSEGALEVVSDKVYVWLPGIRQVIVFDLNGQMVRSFGDPLHALLNSNIEGIEVLFFGFLPGDQLVIQATLHQNKEPYRSTGWFFSADGGQSWSQIEDKRGTLPGGSLVGFTSSGEAVITRPAAFGDYCNVAYLDMIVEFCPVSPTIKGVVAPAIRRQSSQRPSAKPVFVAPFAGSWPRFLFDAPVFKKRAPEHKRPKFQMLSGT